MGDLEALAFRLAGDKSGCHGRGIEAQKYIIKKSPARWEYKNSG